MSVKLKIHPGDSRHGEAHRGNHTAEYDAWASMMGRCYTKTSSPFRFYGARGIVVCDRWHTYANFIVDMGRKPTPEHSLDRIDSNGNYEPGNCRWSTHVEQCRNRRSTRWITLNGERLSMAEWGERTGVDPDLIWYRLKSGWSERDAVFTKPRVRRAA